MNTFPEKIFSLNNKVAIVIGGGGVLGGAMAVGLAKAGASVAVLGRTESNIKARAEESSKYSNSIWVKADASSKTDLENALETIKKEMGIPSILVNAAGINSTTPFFEITEEEWNKILNINLKSVFFSCQVFGKAMVDSGKGGSIINISSASSELPLSKVFTYSISKAGINNLTRWLAREFAPFNVRVNAITPGFFPAKQNRKILTKERVEDIMRHTPMNRFGEPDELVGTVVWLSSDKASGFVTGAIVSVDGGFTSMTI
ncbi:MAG: SDR family oxidoreductase [Candidatus Eremiobacteraeota bacterium]|nr:SDR family oxidoreductase [Candidatus Eremiobacteraeota bacterium]